MIDWILLCGLVSVSRLSFRLLSELLRRPRQGLRRVLIYGAGDGGELLFCPHCDHMWARPLEKHDGAV